MTRNVEHPMSKTCSRHVWALDIGSRVKVKDIHMRILAVRIYGDGSGFYHVQYSVSWVLDGHRNSEWIEGFEIDDYDKDCVMCVGFDGSDK